jgi:hypothetical protein
MNYIKDALPLEIYKEVLFNLTPESVDAVSIVDKYTSELVNDKFYEEYILKTFRLNDYGLESWQISNKPPHKRFLKILIDGININGDAFYFGKGMTKITIKIFPKDTLRKLWNNAATLVGNEYKIYKVCLYFSFNDYSYLIQVDEISARIQLFKMPPKKENLGTYACPFFNDHVRPLQDNIPIISIGKYIADTNLYFLIDRIWVEYILA